ncbi:MAG: PepSY domain-containing protein [Pseudomonadota bacterium]
MKTTWTPPAAALALAISGGQLSAQSPSEPPLASPLTFDEAIAIALEAQPGRIAEVALDRANGRVVIDIEVVNASGDEVEFALDAESGEILWSHVDDDPTDDPDESAEETTADQQ